MWAVTNRTRFAVGRAFARDPGGAEFWLVAVRATFTVASDGRVAVADEQEPVALVPAYEGEPGRSSLRHETDLVRTKSGTDVVLRAAAYAPGGRPAPAVDVSAAVGPVAKRLRVIGDRVWTGGRLRRTRPGAPEPFVRCPIRYERAWGGTRADGTSDLANPAGVGIDGGAGAPVSNVEYPDRPVAAPDHSAPPAGLGPIAAHWAPRLGLAGTYDESWRRTRRPLLPLDFDDAHFRCAPSDQQVAGYLRGGERVTLHNLTPEGRLEFQLPVVRLSCTTYVAEGATHHSARLHTIVIEPDAGRLVMVWHTALACHHTLYTLRETVVAEKPLITLSAPGTARIQ